MSTILPIITIACSALTLVFCLLTIRNLLKIKRNLDLALEVFLALVDVLLAVQKAYNDEHDGKSTLKPEPSTRSIGLRPAG